ncbi:hypothetical protein TNIN_154651 [Trichonephila inaurata madagascariensis]|uniref:Endonuclease/exonuclease/phosphatase domain-containing protein n=1 Tax=Trichonephila inaurata madagascariensis TaxID=2747483 RepID=A0A8X6YJ51_9ARAC|nr:hypothetical protein TNIN_154651 [Trichonephila inaurata madagascariensis]
MFTLITFNRVRNDFTSLRITSWNAQVLRSCVQELENFIHDWNLDIILVQETQLRPCDHVAIPNYSFHRSERTTHRGQTAIFIKRSISHHQIPIQNQAFENTAVVLNKQNDKPITIVSAYRPTKIFTNSIGIGTAA